MTDNSASELTPREKSVIEMIAAGRKPNEIADALNISAKSVEKYLQSAKTKLRRLAP